MRHTLLACLFLFAAACQKATPSQAKPKVPPPADYIGMVSVRSVGVAAAHLNEYVKAVAPGAPVLTPDMLMPMLATAVSVPSVEGLALDQPMHLVCLDPNKFPRPFVLVGSAVDPKKLGESVHPENLKLQGKQALIGDKAAVEAVAAWAQAALGDAPAAPTLRIDLARVVERYRDKIDAFRQNMTPMFASQPMMRTVLEGEFAIMLKLAVQTEELSLSLDADAKEASLQLDLVPRPGTTLEAFGKAQRPASTELVGKIPGVATGSYVIVGDYRLGPARDAVYQLVADMLAAASGSPADPALKKRWDTALDHFAGPVAAVMWMEAGGGFRLSQVIAVDDGEKARTDLKALVPLTGKRTFDVMGLKMTFELREAADTHQGATIDEYSLAFDFGAMADEHQQEMFRKMYGDRLRLGLAGKGSLLYFTWGKDSIADIKSLMDGPGGTPAPGAQAALSAAIGRKASGVTFMDLAAVMSSLTGRTGKSVSGITFEMSFPEGTSRMRIGVPAAHVREIQGAVPK